MTNMFRKNERGNTAIIVLVVLVLVAVGAVAYLSGQIGGKNLLEGSTEPASGEAAATQTAAAAESAPAQPIPEVREGNPVVGKIGDKEVTRVDVFNFIQTLPQQTKQNVPPLQLFDLALNQILNETLIAEKASKVNLDNDPLVKQQLEVAKTQIVRQAFIQKQIEEGMTDERLKSAYDIYVQNFPEIEEWKVRHILVEDEKLAKDLIQKLNDGADFAELAKENSTDVTKENGGSIGYIARDSQIVPEFLEAVVKQEVGQVSKKPVKTDFGYHIIQAEEKRMRPPASFEQAKPFLASQLTNAVLNDIITKWREEADVEAFDINGDPIEPAAGEEAPAPAAEEQAQ